MILKTTWLRLLSLLFVLLSPTWGQADTHLRLVAKEHFKPFSWIENNELKGIDIDLSHELCRRADIECELFLLPWKRALSLVEIGELDGVIGAFKSPEREQFATFLKSPLHYTRQYVYVHKDNTFHFKSIADLYGQTVAINRGFLVSPEFDQALANNDFFYEESENNDINLLRLAYERVDSVVGSERQMNSSIHRLNIQDRVAQIRTPITVPRPSYLALSKASPLNSDLVDRLNTALQQMYEDGTVDEITSSYDQEITIID